VSTLAALDLNLLLVLDTVLAERSVVRAARRLHVTPSAISNSLARLRSVLDDPLIARSGRGIVPTPRALALAPALARALRDLDEAVYGAAFDPTTSNRTFTLAIADAGQVVRMPDLAALLTREMPRAYLRVVGIDSLVSLGGLAGTEVDVAIGPGERGPGIHAEPLYDEHAVLIARVKHPAGPRVTRGALETLRHVAIEMSPARPFRDLAAQTYARAGIPRVVAMSVPSFTAAAAVVARTDLVATIPASLFDVLGARLGLRVLTTPLAAQPITMNLAWHERTHVDPAMRFFRALVRSATSRGGSVRRDESRRAPRVRRPARSRASRAST
jgi:DNA-binding transcriptional LysR family regulator